MYDLNHPVIETRFLLTSNEIARVCNITKDRVFMRRTGVIFYGPARVGKTECCKALSAYLPAVFPNVYVSLVVVVNREGQNCTNIIRQLADVEGCAIKLRDNRLDVFRKLADRISIRVRENGGSQYVCLIDEFQRLRSADLYQLADLYNSLDSNNIKMTVVSFAMAEVLQLRDEFFATEQRQIIARFMSEIITFKGLTNISDFTSILKGYDNFAEHPEGSGISFTRAFLPLAFEGGFRLEKYARPMWDALSDCARGVYRNNLPMQHVLEAIKSILLKCAPNDHEGLTISDADIHFGVESSLLHDFCTVNGSGKVM